MRLIAECSIPDLSALLDRFSLNLKLVADGTAIPGSYWGEPEAGLIQSTIYARKDTPVHSLLHETCHAICMPASRREKLHTDAGGDFDEENAVCYLQILLADRVPGYDSQRCMLDMDHWGYTFRLGSARRWFEQDAADALNWLHAHASDAATLTTIPSQNQNN